MADSPPYPGTPRWVKISGIVVGVLTLLVAIVVVMGVAGPHGPGRHGGDTAGHSGWGRLLLLGALIVAGVAFNWGWLVDRGIAPPRLGRFPILRRSVGRAQKTMPPPVRKLLLVAHVTSSVGSLGGVAAFLALAIVGLTSQDAQTVRAAYVANGFIAWYIILPLLLTALLIGIVQSLGSPWGLFRHYWVLAKFFLTIVTVVVLLNQMEGISHIAAVAAETTISSEDLLGLRRSLRTHAAGGLVVLLVLVALSIYKPRGVTRYGWRRQHERSTLSQP